MSILTFPKKPSYIREDSHGRKTIVTNSIQDVIESIFYPHEVEYTEIEGARYYVLSDIVPILHKPSSGHRLSHQFIVDRLDPMEYLAFKRGEICKFLKVDPSRMRYETEYLVSVKGLYKLFCYLNDAFDYKYEPILILSKMVSKIASSDFDIAKYILEHNDAVL